MNRGSPSHQTGPSKPTLRTLTIGTAGHVDHGKTTLVAALAPTHADRLDRSPDEKRFEGTITLNFAPVTLPSGRLVNVVDVPGHDSLVRTMASGVCGMEAVVLCIACHERVMPQTREHLDILGLLGITRGLIAITMADKIHQPDQRREVEDAVLAAVRGTVLQGAPMIWTSARTREGLAALLDALDRLALELPARDAAGPVRMPVDRLFVAKGFGRVVTGPLLQGTVRVGQQLIALPGGAEVRVRAIQVQGEDATEAAAGDRPALNLAGDGAETIGRGQTLADPRAFDATVRFLAELQLLPTAPTVARRTDLEFLAGTADAQGRVRVYTPGRTLAPGGTETALVEIRSPLVVVHGDLVLVRDTGSNCTIGRVRVLDPHPSDKVDFRVTGDALRTAGGRGAAAAELVKAADAGGVADSALARRIGVTKNALPALVHTSKTYWTQDAVARARETLISAIPKPGHKIPFSTWEEVSPIQNPSVLTRLTRQIIHWFRLRVDGDQLICPQRTSPERARRRGPVPQPVPARPIRVPAGLAAHVEATLRRHGVVTIASPPAVDHIQPAALSAAVQVLCASGRLVRLDRSHAIHPEALDRLLRNLTRPTTRTAIAHTLGTSRTQTHALLGYLLRAQCVVKERDQYTVARRMAHGS